MGGPLLRWWRALLGQRGAAGATAGCDTHTPHTHAPAWLPPWLPSPGFAAMASLACDWLRAVSEPARPAAASPDAPAAPPPQQQQLAAGGHAAAHREGEAHDEAFFLRDMVRQRFDPGAFAGIFSSGGGGAPRWLSALIADEGAHCMLCMMRFACCATHAVQRTLSPARCERSALRCALCSRAAALRFALWAAALGSALQCALR